jgi:hypothetical protein
MEIKFGHRHSLDIGAWIEPDAPIQGLLLEREATVEIDNKKYGVMRVIGVTRAELGLAVTKGVPQLLAKLKKAGVYPDTDVRRESDSFRGRYQVRECCTQRRRDRVIACP